MNAIPTTETKLYTWRFYVLLFGLFLAMCGQGLLAHFGQYVDFIGGDVRDVGILAGTGYVGSLLTRPFAGRWIDRAGARPILMLATTAAAAAFIAFPWVHQLWLAAALRVVTQLGIAFFLVGIAVAAAQIAPPGRSAESLASIGIGGLCGMALGPQVGDLIFAGREQEAWAYHLYFYLGAACLLAACVLSSFVPPAPDAANAPGAEHRPRQSFFRLMTKHWPGAVALVGFCMAAVQTIHMSFLERLADARGFNEIGVFFMVYGCTAIGLRIALRRAPQLYGRQRMLVFGMCSYAAGVTLLGFVRTPVGLLLPGLLMGTGHCFSYPLVVDLATSRMPRENRGLATGVILAVIDCGFLTAHFVWGQLIEWQGFPTTLPIVGLVVLCGISYFAFVERREIIHPTPLA